MKNVSWKKGVFLFGLFTVLAVIVWVSEKHMDKFEPVVVRNGHGEGEKKEQYQFTIPGELEEETVQLEIKEQEYTDAEMKQAFEEILACLDAIVLGENESFDHVEKDLQLVTQVDGYPMKIQWELSSYGVMDIEGHIHKESLQAEGTLVEIRGHITYGDHSSVYVRNVMLYPITREGKDKLIYEIQQAVENVEAQTRQEGSFVLPDEVAGRKLQWSQEKETTWYYLLILGFVLAVYVVYREREQKKRAEEQRKDDLLREYPGMISKITMLLSTGATLRGTWDKIVRNYEMQKTKQSVVYEEMRTTYHEMQGGVLEAEAYEKFGRRCGLTVYVKFGALLSQNLRKGNKGLVELLQMEAIQSFENRKMNAKRKGEEAGAKLMMPMIGMLAVVLIMVMVPAFMSMQL